MKWTKKGFEEFSKGTFGNGGHNIYASAKGVLQRIYNFDINGDGYFDIPLANSHSMDERPEIHVYNEIGQETPLSLPSHGAFDAIFVDLNGNGTEDLVVACQHNGVHTEVSSMIYYGSEQGLCEKYKCELRAPNSLGVAAGDFNGCGRKSLAFISGSCIRIFYSGDIGIEPCKFTDIPIDTLNIAAGDLDGDGYDDLYVMHTGNGALTIYWGGEDGINPDRKTDFGTVMEIKDFRASATTEGRKLARWVTWRPNVLNMHGKMMTYRVEKDNIAVIESFGKNRQPKEEYRFVAFDPEKIEHFRNPYRWGGIMYVGAGDLKNCGNCDIIIAVSTDCDKTEDLIVLWEDKGYSMEEATRVPIRAARTVHVGPAEKDGKNLLFVAQGSERDKLTVTAKVFSFDENGAATEVWSVRSDEASRFLSGRTYTDGRYQMVVANHEGEGMLGIEPAYIYLGGEDGYSADRRIELPGLAPVNVIMADLNDDGLPEAFVMNCAENAPWLSKGFAIYWNTPDGLSEDNCTYLARPYDWGCVIGDFRHSGYLDIIAGGVRSRELLVFPGGPDGYDPDNPQIIRFGGDSNKGITFDWPEEDLDPVYDAEDNELFRLYGFMHYMFCADLNGDGYLDLILPTIRGDNVFILWGGPDGFSVDNCQKLAAEGVGSVNVADLDGDGYPDLILGGFNCLGRSQVKECYYTIYWGGPDGLQEHRKSQLPAFCSNSLTIQDFNNDGILDIFGVAYYGVRTRDAEATIYFGSEDGMFHQNNYQKILNHSGSGCLSGDFNGDGYIDLIIANHKNHGHHVCDSYVYWGGPDGINPERRTPLPGRGPHGTSWVDPGNIMDRSDSEYYYSEAYKIPDGTVPVKASWEATNGVKTWVKMQIRCAETEDALEATPWQGDLENGDSLKDLNLKGYIQYKLELGAKCGCGTPRVTEVTIDFE